MSVNESTANGPLLLLAQDEGPPVELGHGSARVTATAFVRPEAPRPNEDSVAVIPLPNDDLVLAVADGVGGHRGGGDASRTAVRALAAALTEPGEQSVRSRVVDGFERANTAVIELGIGALTTLVVAAITGREMRSFHVGDSTALLFGQRGRLKLQTVDHTPVGYAVESGAITAQEAMTHPDRHLLTNAVGNEDMRIDIGPVRKLNPHDTVVLASDGLFDNLTVDEIVEVSRHGDVLACTEALVKNTRRRMARENPLLPGKPDDFGLVLCRPGKRGA